MVQRKMKEEEEVQEKQQDMAFVLSVMAREKALAEQEEAEKQKARQKAIEFTEALKVEMARKAESEWQKRYAQWEKEEIARRKLLEEVYTDRAEQVELKEKVRMHVKNEVVEDRKRVDLEVE